MRRAPLLLISLFKEWEALNSKYSKSKSFLKNKYRLRGRIKRIEVLGGGPYDMGIIGLFASTKRSMGPLYDMINNYPTVEERPKTMVYKDGKGNFVWNY